MINSLNNSLLIRFVLPALAVIALVFSTARYSQAEDITGTIAETMNAAGYTYLLLDTGSDKIWVAIPETEVTAGEKVSAREGMEMVDFHSNAMDRTFKSIIFSPGLAGAKATGFHGTTQKPKPADDSFAAAVAAEKSTSAQAQPVEPVEGSGGSQGAIAPFADTEIEKATGDNSYTVAEIFAQAEALNGKKVRVRGLVVKFNANIMNRNWLHLQDGTGDPMTNTHDLVATSSSPIGESKVVTVEGTVAANQDFGFGYKYAVLIENCTIIE